MRLFKLNSKGVDIKYFQGAPMIFVVVVEILIFLGDAGLYYCS